MEFGKPIVVDQEKIKDFFKDMVPNNQYRRTYSDIEKQIIITAFEEGYNKDDVARKLHTDVRIMKRWYAEYKKGKA